MASNLELFEQLKNDDISDNDLSLLDDKKYKNKFNDIFNELSENDKFLVYNLSIYFNTFTQSKKRKSALCGD
jgi:hypothetical protein